MDNQCASCKQSVPQHFQNKGIRQCLTCVSVKVSLAGQIKPDPREHAKDAACILCGQNIPIGLPRSALCEDCLHEIETNTGATYFHLYRTFSQPWLVRSSGVILGPLSAAEVEAKIRNKEIGLFDVVQKPYGRWVYAREEPTLKDVVEEVRSRPSSREDTVALTTGDSTAVTSVGDPALSATGQYADPYPDTISGARQVEALNNDQVPMRPQQFGDESQPSTAFRNFLAFGFILFLAAAVVTIVSLSSGEKMTDREVKTSLQAAKDSFYAGDFDAARNGFRKVSDQLDNESLFNYTALLIDQGFLAEADTFLVQLNAQVIDAKDKSKILVLKALKTLFSGEVSESEDFLKSALELDRTSAPAIFNLANVYILKGEPDRAIDTLNTLENPPTDKELWNLLLADAAASKIKVNGPNDEVRKIVEKVSILNPPAPYATEISLLVAFMHIKLGDKPGAAVMVEGILKLEPEVTDLTVPNLLLYRKRTTWQSLETYCNDVRNTLPESTLGSLLWSYCQVRSGETTKGKDLAQEVFLKKESDPLARSTLAYAQLKVGKHDEAESLLKGKLRGTPLEYWVMSKACETLKNQACVEEYIGKLLDISPSSPYGIDQKLVLALAKSDRAEYTKWLETARERTWYYQPIRQIELNQREL